mgnify:CR=1 FL=1
MATDGVRSEQPKPFINVDRLLVHMLVKHVLGTCIRGDFTRTFWCAMLGILRIELRLHHVFCARVF